MKESKIDGGHGAQGDPATPFADLGDQVPRRVPETPAVGDARVRQLDLLEPVIACTPDDIDESAGQRDEHERTQLTELPPGEFEDIFE